MYKNVESLEVITACNRHANVITAAWLWASALRRAKSVERALVFSNGSISTALVCGIHGSIGELGLLSLWSLFRYSKPTYEFCK